MFAALPLQLEAQERSPPAVQPHRFVTGVSNAQMLVSDILIFLDAGVVAVTGLLEKITHSRPFCGILIFFSTGVIAKEFVSYFCARVIAKVLSAARHCLPVNLLNGSHCCSHSIT